MLSSLKIKNFRSLQDVEIPKLGRLNLIVGNNNSGKSSLIEALLIYANSADENLLNELAYAHGEPLIFDRDEEESISSFLPFESFFANRAFPTEDNVKIEIGEIDNENSILSIEHCFERELLIKFDDEDGGVLRRIKYESISKGVINLEEEIDKMNSKLSSLTSFILPGGTKSSSFLHLARTVTRRCERTLVKLNSKEKIDPEIIKYINRLSDFLFVLARIENIKDGDILWVPNKK